MKKVPKNVPPVPQLGQFSTYLADFWHVGRPQHHNVKFQKDQQLVEKKCSDQQTKFRRDIL